MEIWTLITFENRHVWNLNTLLHYTLPFLTGLMLWLEDSFYRLGYRGACYLLKYIAMLHSPLSYILYHSTLECDPMVLSYIQGT